MHAMKRFNLDSCFDQSVDAALKMSSFHNTFVADNESPTGTEFSGQFAESRNCAGTEDESCCMFEVDTFHTIA